MLSSSVVHQKRTSFKVFSSDTYCQESGILLEAFRGIIRWPPKLPFFAGKPFSAHSWTGTLTLLLDKPSEAWVLLGNSSLSDSSCTHDTIFLVVVFSSIVYLGPFPHYKSPQLHLSPEERWTTMTRCGAFSGSSLKSRSMEYCPSWSHQTLSDR